MKPKRQVTILASLLTIATVCTRLNRLKTNICLKKQKLVICEHWQQQNERVNSVSDMFPLVGFNVLNVLTIRDVNQNYGSIRKCYVYRKLTNLARIFPRITHFCVFQLEFTISSDSYVESYVEEVAKLLQCWSGTLIELNISINRQFYNSILVKTINFNLLQLQSLTLDLGIETNSTYQIELLFSVASRRLHKCLFLGPLTNRQIEQFYWFMSQPNSTPEWGLIYRSKSENIFTNLIEPRNVQCERSLTKLSLELNRQVSIEDLEILCLQFSQITYLEVLICINFWNMLFAIDFVGFIRICSVLTKLRVLKIIFPTHSQIKSRFNSLYFPLWDRPLHTLPELVSVESIHIYASENRQLVRVIHPPRCTCGYIYRFIAGSTICCLANAFPNAREVTFNRTYQRHLNYKMYCTLFYVLYMVGLFVLAIGFMFFYDVLRLKYPTLGLFVVLFWQKFVIYF